MKKRWLILVVAGALAAVTGGSLSPEGAAALADVLGDVLAPLEPGPEEAPSAS